jgi:uncharacterized membrane protein required for colicin V production
MLTGILILIVIICAAMLWNEGLWGNAITLVNVTLAALIATNYYEPIAAMIENVGETTLTYTYFWDFLAIWLLFVVVYSIMRTVTDFLTKTKVKFKAPIEHTGRILLALMVGYVMMAFTAMTLHMAPVPEHAFGGAFHQATKAKTAVLVDKNLPNHFLGILAPDRAWLYFVQSRSQAGGDGRINGALARWWGQRTFDPESRFVFKYGARRRKLEQYNNEKKQFRVHPMDLK